MNLLKRIAVGGVLTSTLLSGAVAQAQEYIARLSVHWGPKHHSAIHTQMFADEVNRRAEGRLRIDVFPSGQLLYPRTAWGCDVKRS